MVLPPSCDISCPALAIILLVWARQLQLLADLLDYQNIMTIDGGNEGGKKIQKNVKNGCRFFGRCVGAVWVFVRVCERVCA